MKIKNVQLVAVIALGCLIVTGCKSHYQMISYTGGRYAIDSKYDINQDQNATIIIAPYKKTVDSIMSPVIGHSDHQLTVYRPESELSNLVADILRYAASEYIGKPVDIGIINMGGLRSSLPEGDITFGNIYEITPFENSLCIIKMSGKNLRGIFTDMAKVHGEGLSGAQLVINKEGELISAKVSGQNLDDNKTYVIATIDYIAEGNDHLTTFKKFSDADKIMPKGVTVRQLFLNHVTDTERQGKKVNSKIEGRIIIKE